MSPVLNSELLDALSSKIKVELEQIKRQARSIRDELLRSTEIRPALVSDELDHAKEHTDLCTQIEVHERSLETKNRLLSALQKIEQGSFGSCENCDENISVDRLKVNPSAALCLRCQELKERKAKVSRLPFHSFRFQAPAAFIGAVS